MTKPHIENDTKMQTLLEEGEKILWSGVSEPFSLITQDARKFLLMLWGICALLAIVFFVLYMQIDDSDMRSRTLKLVLIILAFLVFLCVRPLADRRKIQARNSYYLTDRRAVWMDGKDTVYSLNRYDMEWEKYPTGENTLHLLMHRKGVQMPWNYRDVAWRPRTEEAGTAKVTSMVFYQIAESEDLEKALK